MIKVDLEKARELIAQAVADKGANYTYKSETRGSDPYSGPGCWYVEQDDVTPSCIVGHVVSYVAPELIGDIAEWESSEARSHGDTDARSLFERFEGEILVTEDAQSYLYTAQKYQDYGEPWGAALNRAEASIA